MHKRFIAINSDYDDTAYKIADTSKVKKRLEDFYNEKEECYEYYEYLGYLYDNTAFLSKEEVLKILNRGKETNDNFKQYIIEFNKAKEDLKKSQRKFKYDVVKFMKERELSTNIHFFGKTFGIDVKNYPYKISLKILSEFCNEFGCDFEQTTCDGKRYIFSFQGLTIGHEI